MPGLISQLHELVITSIAPLWEHPLFPTFPSAFIMQAIDVISGVIDSEHSVKKEVKVLVNSSA